MHQVAEIMTPRPITMHVEDTLESAWKLMRNHHIRHIPVTRSDRKLVGLVTHRNLMINTQNINQLTLPVAEIMDSDVVTIDAEADLRQAITLLQEKKIGCLPVMRDGQLVGMLTSSDFLALAKRLLG